MSKFLQSDLFCIGGGHQQKGNEQNAKGHKQRNDTTGKVLISFIPTYLHS